MRIKAPSIFEDVEEVIKFIDNNKDEIILDITSYYRDKAVRELEERDGPVDEYYERHGLDTPPYEHIVEYREYEDEEIDEYILNSSIGEKYFDDLDQLTILIKNNSDWVTKLLNNILNEIDDAEIDNMLIHRQDPLTVQAQNTYIDMDVIDYFYELIGS